MIEIRITGDTPLEALTHLAAFGMHCMQNDEISTAARRILEAEQHEEKKRTVPVAAPMTVSGPAGGENGQTAAPSEVSAPPAQEMPKADTATKPMTGSAPSLEAIRAKGIEAAKKYGQAAVKAILKELNAENMTALPEDKRAEFLVKLEGLGGGNA